MSDDVHYSGILKKLDLTGSWAQRIAELEKRGFGIGYHEEEDNYLESEDVVIANGEWYQIVTKDTVSDDVSIFHAEKINEEIKYNVKYYNGGCNFREAIETSLDKMENK